MSLPTPLADFSAATTPVGGTLVGPTPAGQTPVSNLQLLVLFPGATTPMDLTEYLAYSGTTSMTTEIMQNFGNEGDTATIVLIDEHPDNQLDYYIPPMSQILLQDLNPAFSTLAVGQNIIFAGVVTEPIFVYCSPNNTEWQLNCVDYTFYADNAVVQGVYIGKTMQEIVIDITTQANCGIIAAPLGSGGYVAPGPVIPVCSLTYQSLSNAWTTIAALASFQTSFGWYVDANLQLHFIDENTAVNTHITFTTEPTTTLSVTEGHIQVDEMFQYQYNGNSLITRAIVQGGTQTNYADTSNAPTDSWVSNGYQTSYPLTYTPNVTGSSTPNGTLEIGGAQVDVGINEGTSITIMNSQNSAAGGASTTTGNPDWLINQSSNGQYFLIVNPGVGSPPPAGTTIQFWYDYQVNIVAQADNFASEQLYAGPNGGIFETYVDDSSLTSMSTAFNYALGIVQEYGTVQELFTFDTTGDWVGNLRAGDVFMVSSNLIPDSTNNYQLGLQDYFMVTTEMISFTDGGYRIYEITAVRLGFGAAFPPATDQYYYSTGYYFGSGYSPEFPDE